MPTRPSRRPRPAECPVGVRGRGRGAVAGVAAVAVVVVVVVACACWCGRACRRRRVADEHGGADGGDQHAARDAEPAEHDLAGEAGGSGEQQAKDQHAAGVRQRHGRADDERVARSALSAGEVGRHHGLAVPGQRGVAGAEQRAPGRTASRPTSGVRRAPTSRSSARSAPATQRLTGVSAVGRVAARQRRPRRPARPAAGPRADRAASRAGRSGTCAARRSPNAPGSAGPPGGHRARSRSARAIRSGRPDSRWRRPPWTVGQIGAGAQDAGEPGRVQPGRCLARYSKPVGRTVHSRAMRR